MVDIVSQGDPHHLSKLNVRSPKVTKIWRGSFGCVLDFSCLVFGISGSQSSGDRPHGCCIHVDQTFTDERVYKPSESWFSVGGSTTGSLHDSRKRREKTS